MENVLRSLILFIRYTILHGCSPVVLQQHSQTHFAHTELFTIIWIMKKKPHGVCCLHTNEKQNVVHGINLHIISHAQHTQTHSNINDSIYFSVWMHQQRINVLWLAHSAHRIRKNGYFAVSRDIQMHVLVSSCILPQCVYDRIYAQTFNSELWFSMLTIMTIM